jgi:hypothetical protein
MKKLLPEDFELTELEIAGNLGRVVYCQLLVKRISAIWIATMIKLNGVAKIGMLVIMYASPIVLFPVTATQAAELERKGLLIFLRGSIAPGDSNKLKAIISVQPAKTMKLYSKGGDVNEAIKIGKIVRELKMTTSASHRVVLDHPSVLARDLRNSGVSRENFACASACFLVWLAGVERSGDLVGIHRPYLPNNTLKNYDLSQAEEIYSELKSASEAYLEEMNVSTDWADRMFSISSTDVYWLDHSEIESDFAPLPAIDEWLSTQCHSEEMRKILSEYNALDRKAWTQPDEPVNEVLGEAGWRRFVELSDKKQKFDDCRFKAQEKLMVDAWREFLERHNL